MAGEPTDTLRQGVAAAVILKLATSLPADSDPARVGVLKLAAALVQLAEGGQLPGSAVLDETGGTAATSIRLWSEACTEVLAAMSYTLAGLKPALEGAPAPTGANALPAVAERLAEQTNSTHDTLSGVCGALRAGGTRLLQRASQVGVLTRALQQERIRLKQDIENAAAVERELTEAKTQRGQVAKALELLEERLRLASATPEQCRKLEAEVKEAEARAAEYTKQLQPLETRLAVLQEQLRQLPEQISQTKELISELENSVDHEKFREIRRIWQALEELHQRPQPC